MSAFAPSKARSAPGGQTFLFLSAIIPPQHRHSCLPTPPAAWPLSVFAPAKTLLLAEQKATLAATKGAGIRRMPSLASRSGRHRNTGYGTAQCACSFLPAANVGFRSAESTRPRPKQCRFATFPRSASPPFPWQSDATFPRWHWYCPHQGWSGSSFCARRREQHRRFAYSRPKCA
jgi:hypothetical protein